MDLRGRRYFYVFRPPHYRRTVKFEMAGKADVVLQRKRKKEERKREPTARKIFQIRPKSHLSCLVCFLYLTAVVNVLRGKTAAALCRITPGTEKKGVVQRRVQMKMQWMQARSRCVGDDYECCEEGMTVLSLENGRRFLIRKNAHVGYVLLPFDRALRSAYYAVPVLQAPRRWSTHAYFADIQSLQ